MKSNHILLLLALIMVGCKNGSKTAEKSMQKTENHVNVPGTKLYLIPPEGFTLSTSKTKGFTNKDKGCFIMVSVETNESYDEIIRETPNSNFENEGYKILKEEVNKIGIYNCKWLKIKDGESIVAWRLVFGDSSFAATLTATAPAQNEGLINQIYEALQTVVYDKSMEMKETEITGMDFSVLPNESQLLFKEMMDDMAVFSLKGEDYLNTESDAPFLAISQKNSEGHSAKEFAERLAERLIKNGYKIIKIRKDAPLTIQGNDAYEIVADAVRNGNDAVLYNVAIVKGNIAILVGGLAKENINETIAKYNLFTNAIVLKE